MMMSSGVWQRLPFMVLCLCSTLWWLQGAPWWVNTCQILSQKKFAKKLLKIPWASSLLQVFGGLCKWSSIQADSRDISGGAWGEKKSHELWLKINDDFIIFPVFKVKNNLLHSFCISVFLAPWSTSRCDCLIGHFPPDWIEGKWKRMLRSHLTCFWWSFSSRWKGNLV